MFIYMISDGNNATLLCISGENPAYIPYAGLEHAKLQWSGQEHVHDTRNMPLGCFRCSEINSGLFWYIMARYIVIDYSKL